MRGEPEHTPTKTPRRTTEQKKCNPPQLGLQIRMRSTSNVHSFYGEKASSSCIVDRCPWTSFQRPPLPVEIEIEMAPREADEKRDIRGSEMDISE